MARIPEKSSSDVYFLISFPLIYIFPLYGARAVDMHFKLVDLPVPLPPTMENISPFLNLKLRPLRTSGRSFSYLNQISLTSSTGSFTSGSYSSPLSTKLTLGISALNSSERKFLPSLTVSGHSPLPPAA